MFPVALEEVKVTEPPEQNDVGPLALIDGVDGLLLLTIVWLDVELQVPFETLTVKFPLFETVID